MTLRLERKQFVKSVEHDPETLGGIVSEQRVLLATALLMGDDVEAEKRVLIINVARNWLSDKTIVSALGIKGIREMLATDMFESISKLGTALRLLRAGA